MGFEWEYQEDHGYVSHLDGVFREGNAPKLAGMVRSLANFSAPGTWTPRYLDIHKIQILAGNDGEYRSRSYELVKAHEMMCDEYSILQGSARSDPRPDLTVEQFFYHADILSGQDIGKVPEHLNALQPRLDLKNGGWAEDAVRDIDAAPHRTIEQQVVRIEGAPSLGIHLLDRPLDRPLVKGCKGQV